MKKVISLLICLFTLTGCFKRDDMEDINIYTTIYPIEYVVNRLYGEYSNVDSVYPNGVNIQLEKCEDCNLNYILTEKQLSDYSSTDLFVFNSLLYESNYVKPMFSQNRQLKIINAADNLTTSDFYDLEETWLDPSRLLTLSRNIKNGLEEYITNYYLKQDINNNFEKLKEELDILGTKLIETVKNADNKILVTGNDLFKFFERDKYGLTVYSLEENENLNEKTINTVKELIDNKTIKYIYIKQYDEENETIKKLIKDTDVEVIKLHMISNLTENEISNKKDYFTIINENIELLKKNLYN